MAVITISRQFGAGALLLGHKICQKTGFHMVFENIINEILRKEKVHKNWLDPLTESSVSMSLQILSNIAPKELFYKTLGIPADAVERKRYIEVLTDMMTQMADKGGFVIIGRGAQFILKDHPKTIHILLISEYEKRVHLVAKAFKISSDEAKDIIRAKEKQRSDFAKNIFKSYIDDPSHYHMVLNTGKIKLGCAVDTTLAMLENRIKQEKVVR